MTKTMATTDRYGIRTTQSGYVRDVACEHNHAGNTGFVLAHGEYYACQGCGTFLHVTTIRRLQAQESR